MKTKTKPFLAIVATPIGNLRDITLRALDILKEVDVIFCEDTRVSKKLLNKYGIKTPTKSYHTHSGERGFLSIKNTLLEGKNCALVTDAGTPGISDPGPSLVARIHKEIGNEVTITPIPGPDAVSALLSVAGISVQPYTFYGFIPTKKGRQSFLRKVIESEYTSIFYESTHRILKLLQELQTHEYKGKLILGRELTKIHEEILQDSPVKLEKLMEQEPNKKRGEFVVMMPKQAQ